MGRPRGPGINIPCVRCGKVFWVDQARYDSGRGKYCSRTCQHPLRDQPIFVQFWSKVRITEPGECWLWIPSDESGDYGGFRYHGRQYVPSRMAWALEHGRLPGKLYVCHHCDTPACCNPKHLFLGTQDQNMQDCSRKGRTTHGAKNRHARLSNVDVILIRHWYDTGQYTQAELVRGTKASKATIHNIVRRKTWHHEG
jgi:hypothetical protein